MKFLGVLSIFIFLISCHYDNADEIKGMQACDTLYPSYSLCIKPIFRQNCYSCHSNVASQNGNIALDIENYDSLKTYLRLSYRGSGVYGSKFMAVIGDSLYVVHMPPFGPMPKQDVRTVDRWISNGAQNN